MPGGDIVPFSLGFATLGGLVQPLVEAGASYPLKRSIHAICYRPDQLQSRLQLIAFPQGKPEESVAILTDSFATGGKHPGSEHYVLDVSLKDSSEVLVTAKNGTTSLCLLLKTIHLPDSLDGLPEVECPSSDELASRLLSVHAEVMMRWFRGLLREREVRLGTRDIVYQTRDATTAIEDAIDSGDVKLLKEQLRVLRHYGDEVCKRTNITPFPRENPLVILPEPS